MQRIRVLRIVVPILLAVFVAAIALTLRFRPDGGATPVAPLTDHAARMEGFRFSDLVGGRRRLLVQAKVGRVDDQGSFEVEDVERVEVDREGQAPLLLTAPRGKGSGPQGKRVVHLEGGVTLKDDEAGMGLTIPAIQLDQIAGEVRSVGAVELKNAEWNGTATSVVYSLTGGPTLFAGLAFDGPEGGKLRAERGTLPPGSDTMTLEGAVEAGQGGMTLRADYVVLVRRPDGRMESVTASPSVTGTAQAVGGRPASFAARELRGTWDAAGRLDSARLSGGAQVTHDRGTIRADVIDAKAANAASALALSAATQVEASGPTSKGQGVLTCDALSGTLDRKGTVRDGVARGHVRFDAEGTAGEAAEARFTTLGEDGTVTLLSSPDRRARLASGRTRVVADSIVSDVKGARLKAEGRVESTLLGGPGSQPAKSSPMFSKSEAVHFVSASLDSVNSGARLLLKGDVRGWQGERTLSADEVEMIQAGEIMNARGRVATRMPRESTRATSEADYIQIAAERLAYKGAERTAEYEGRVRVRQAEGWLETPQLLANLNEGGPGLREVAASQGVRFEYRSPGDRAIPNTAAGDGDRAIYDATSRTLRVFGDKQPATVRSTGPKGGTTVGRVLRYDLATGAIEVESGERDRAIIRTPKE